MRILRLLLMAGVLVAALVVPGQVQPASADGPCYAIRKPCEVSQYQYFPDDLCCVHPRGGCSYCW